LTEAIEEFRKNYQKFCENNKQFISIETEFQIALDAAPAREDIRHATKAFSDSIREVLHVVKTKRKLAEGTWTTKLGSVLSKLYPVTRLSLGLAGVIGNVIISPIK
jgi:hypothetical protein